MYVFLSMRVKAKHLETGEMVVRQRQLRFLRRANVNATYSLIFVENFECVHVWRQSPAVTRLKYEPSLIIAFHIFDKRILFVHENRAQYQCDKDNSKHFSRRSFAPSFSVSRIPSRTTYAIFFFFSISSAKQAIFRNFARKICNK